MHPSFVRLATPVDGFTQYLNLGHIVMLLAGTREGDTAVQVMHSDRSRKNYTGADARAILAAIGPGRMDPRDLHAEAFFLPGEEADPS